jgi:hypothetical protein
MWILIIGIFAVLLVLVVAIITLVAQPPEQAVRKMTGFNSSKKTQ